MENASKALIIAGAILLSILLISLGIMVYNNAKGTVSSSNLSAEEIQTFNTKFTQYSGTQRGTALNSLVDTIAANNGNNQHSVILQTTISGSTTRYGNAGDQKTVSGNSGSMTIAVGVSNEYPRFSDSQSGRVTFYPDSDGYVAVVRIDV